jgi:hypothetical protein
LRFWATLEDNRLDGRLGCALRHASADRWSIGNRVDRIAPFSDASSAARGVARAGEDGENSQMSKSLRVFAACAVLAGLAACAAPPPPTPVVTAPPPKSLDAKTQLENHM